MGAYTFGYTYDFNGNLTVQTVNGQTTRFGWDDKDRLTSQMFLDSHRDTCTTLRMRPGNNDPSGVSRSREDRTERSPLMDGPLFNVAANRCTRRSGRRWR